MESIYNFIKSGIYGLFVFLGIRTASVEALFYLMLADSLLGIIKALRLGYSFSFKRLGWGFVTKISLLIVPMVLALIGKGLSMDFKMFVLFALNVLVVNEGISCITNILSIKTKQQIENTDYITMMLRAIKTALGSLITKFLTSFEIDSKNKKAK